MSKARPRNLIFRKENTAPKKKTDTFCVCPVMFIKATVSSVQSHHSKQIKYGGIKCSYNAISDVGKSESIRNLGYCIKTIQCYCSLYSSNISPYHHPYFDAFTPLGHKFLQVTMRGITNSTRLKWRLSRYTLTQPRRLPQNTQWFWTFVCNKNINDSAAVWNKYYTSQPRAISTNHKAM